MFQFLKTKGRDDVMRKKMAQVIVGLLIICGLTTVGFSAPSKQVIKISFGSSDNHPITKTLREHYVKLINEKTNNKYDVQVYTSAQLGDDLRATEAVRAGMLDAVVTTLAPVGGIVRETMVFDLPFLFTDEQVADKILSGPVARTLNQKMAKKGLICLAWYENGFRHLSNNVREIKSAADLKGLKIRTMENPIHLAAWRKLGANPTPMPFSEVFTALQQHVIDGQENPIPTFYDGKFYEVQKYLTLTGHIYSPYVLLFSKKIFDKMPKKDQKIFLQVGKDTEAINRKIVRTAAKTNLDYIEKQGITVTNLTAEQKKVFQDMLQPVWDQFSDKIGIDIIKQVRTELKKVK
jgi:tripartite ATP-independent transporter DctP family solute receptor